MAWTAAEAAKPLGWEIVGVWRFGGEWIALCQGPGSGEYLSGSGGYAEQALRRLADRLRDARGPVTG